MIPPWLLTAAHMPQSPSTIDLQAVALRHLAAAPHRLLFFAGASAVLVAMSWWALWLHGAWLGQPSSVPGILPAGWAHALGTQYQVLPLFMFGFLLTVFPRWMGLKPFTRRHYLPVGLGLFGGYILFHAGLWLGETALHLGWALTLLGWTCGWLLLLRALWQSAAVDGHAIACWLALSMGLLGLALVAAFLHGGDARFAFGAIKLGTFGVLLPIYVSVCHRMLPFFSANAIPGYQAFRPGAWLWAMLSLCFLHLLLELMHAYAWLWSVDLPMAALAVWMAWRWQGWRARHNRLLLVLHWGFAWLPLALILYTVQSLWLMVSGEFILARAPVHVLTVGFFGSLLLAMVTRVTQGHSGRPLQMGRVPWLCFLVLQGVVLLRVAAEFVAAPLAWLAAAALGWVFAFLPWALRSLWIYLTPRLDGAPG